MTEKYTLPDDITIVRENRLMVDGYPEVTSLSPLPIEDVPESEIPQIRKSINLIREDQERYPDAAGFYSFYDENHKLVSYRIARKGTFAVTNP